MKLARSYPMLCVSDVTASRKFYVEQFRFEIVFDTEWYSHLVHADDPSLQLGLVAHDHESVPREQRKLASGVLLGFEVTDAASEYERLVAAGASIEQELRDEDWGQRHFMVRDPDGVVIDVIENLDPALQKLDDRG